MSSSKNFALLGCSLIISLGLGLFTPVQQSCAMEQELREDYLPQQEETNEVQSNTTEKGEEIPDYTLHLPPNPFTDNSNSLYATFSRNWFRMMWGITAYNVITSPQFPSHCVKIIPYLPDIACLTAGGLYLLHSYQKKWALEKEAEDERYLKEIRQKVQAESDAIYAKIRAETAEMLKHYNTL